MCFDLVVHSLISLNRQRNYPFFILLSIPLPPASFSLFLLPFFLLSLPPSLHLSRFFFSAPLYPPSSLSSQFPSFFYLPLFSSYFLPSPFFLSSFLSLSSLWPSFIFHHLSLFISFVLFHSLFSHSISFSPLPISLPSPIAWPTAWRVLLTGPPKRIPFPFNYL